MWGLKTPTPSASPRGESGHAWGKSASTWARVPGTSTWVSPCERSDIQKLI